MLQFDPVAHAYTYEGRRVPNVTSILAPLSNLDQIPIAVLERKRQIGTAVHAAIEMDLDNTLDYNEIDPSWGGYFAGWLQFRAESGFAVEAAEERVYSKRYGYAGTLDLLGELPNAGRVLIDTKTCAVLPRTAGPQTAAYAHARRVAKVKRFALQLGPDGSYRLAPLNYMRDFDVFLAALSLYQWSHQS